MLLSFNITNLPEPTEKEIKVLMAVIMQNGLMIQQLQLMVAMQEKEKEEEKRRKENQQQKEREREMEEEKQSKLIEEEVQSMKGWSEEESQKHMEKFRGYRGDMRCRRCRWFGHMAQHCRREKIKAEKELKGGGLRIDRSC